MADVRRQIASNLAAIQARIGAAAGRAQRAANDVRLIAVTKYVESATARAVAEAGCLDLGESRPQTLWGKVDDLREVTPPIRWHFIGHLQRNKLDRTLTDCALIHSGDSLRLLQAINEFGQKQQRRIAVLVEINISGDATKQGFAPAAATTLGDELNRLAHIDVRGLMCMASREGDQDRARREFAAVRELRDRLKQEWPSSCALCELSMGMSGDFETAIEEGATLVRVGSALFEGLS